MYFFSPTYICIIAYELSSIHISVHVQIVQLVWIKGILLNKLCILYTVGRRQIKNKRYFTVPMGPHNRRNNFGDKTKSVPMTHPCWKALLAHISITMTTCATFLTFGTQNWIKRTEHINHSHKYNLKCIHEQFVNTSISLVIYHHQSNCWLLNVFALQLTSNLSINTFSSYNIYWHMKVLKLHYPFDWCR